MGGHDREDHSCPFFITRKNLTLKKKGEKNASFLKLPPGSSTNKFLKMCHVMFYLEFDTKFCLSNPYQSCKCSCPFSGNYYTTGNNNL
jgi:hypothetical protein